MKQPDISTKRRGGKHFDMETRIRMETMVKCLYPRGKRPNFTVIANGLGRSRSSVSREYRRGLVASPRTSTSLPVLPDGNDKPSEEPHEMSESGTLSAGNTSILNSA